MVKRTEPSIPVTDKRFRYMNAANTDIRKRFAELAQEKAPNVEPIKRKAKS